VLCLAVDTARSGVRPVMGAQPYKATGSELSYGGTVKNRCGRGGSTVAAMKKRRRCDGGEKIGRRS
jgi:hypothetical protein